MNKKILWIPFLMTLMVIRNAMAQDRVKEDFRPSDWQQWRPRLVHLATSALLPLSTQPLEKIIL